MISNPLTWFLLAFGANAAMYTIFNLTTVTRSNGGERIQFMVSVGPDYVRPNGRQLAFVERAAITFRTLAQYHWNEGNPIHLDTAEEPWLRVFIQNTPVLHRMIVCTEGAEDLVEELFPLHWINGTEYSLSYKCRRDARSSRIPIPNPVVDAAGPQATARLQAAARARANPRGQA